MATALAYVVSADMRHPYYVYIGLQDNGSWGGPSAVRGRGGIMNSHWFGIGGGDGFYTAVDPTDYNIVITESQDGATNRYNLAAADAGRASGRTPAADAARRRAARGARVRGGAVRGGAQVRRAPRRSGGSAGAGRRPGRFGGRGGAPNVLNAIPATATASTGTRR
jgi:hypothetical protein